MIRRRRLGTILVGASLILLGGSLSSQEKQSAKQKQDKETEKVEARLRVLLPAEAILTIDETPTQSPGPERRFVTPPLSRGKTYYYTLKWTYAGRSGRPITRMTVVEFQPGRDNLVDLRPGSKTNASSEIIFVPTSQDIVDKMLSLAKVTAKDIVYDLGCGDGRIVVTAAKKYSARGVGIDIDPARVRDSQANVDKNKVEDQVEIRQGDALQVADISRATVVTLYMLPEFQKKLVPILKRELKPGARIVSHDYTLPGWKAAQTVNLPGMFRPHTLYLYKVEGTENEKEKDKGK